MKQPLPPITSKQQDILLLIYRYRFLKRIHIQKLMHHKQFNQIILWLNDLTEKKYIKRYYQPSFAPSMAYYSLGTMGRKYLKKHSELPGIKESLLNRVWREEHLSPQFKNHCMVVADSYLSLQALTEKTKATIKFYTKTDLDGMKHLITPHPDAFFAITETTETTKRYFLDIIDSYLLPKQRKLRILQYFKYYEKEIWQKHNTNSFPEIILICPDDWTKQSLYKFIQKLLEKESRMRFSLCTLQDIREKGISKETLQKVEKKILHSFHQQL